MTLEGTLKKRDGALYVFYAYDESSEPFQQQIWYRVLETRGTGYGERPEVGDYATRVSGGEWRTRNSSTHRATGSVSTGTGAAPAEWVERVSIPPPAAGGKELRWHDGRWEKLLARGWVPASVGKSGATRKSPVHATKRPLSTPVAKTSAQLEAEITEALRARKWQEQVERADRERRERLARRTTAPTPEQLYEEYQADVAAGVFHGEPRGRASAFRRDRSTRRSPDTAPLAQRSRVVTQHLHQYGLPNGRARGRHPSEFDPVQLRRGTQVEMEHTRDPKIAARIAMDHLVEDPLYYVKLAKIHVD